MKTLTVFAALVLALGAAGCSEPAGDTAPAAAPDAGVGAADAANADAADADDDNDAPEPAAAPAADEEPHDESVPHDH